MLSSVGWAALGVGFIFLMTSLGAVSVLFCREDASIKSQTGMMGFAGGVMTAATVWSMLLPAIEQTRSEGTLPCWLPAAAGTAAGAAFLCALDALILRLRRGGSAEKSSMLMTAITLHNIPEGMAVGLAFALSGGADGLTAAAALALGIGVQNVPEGAAVSLPLRRMGMSRGRAFSMGVLSGAVEPLFGMLAVMAVSGISRIMPWLLGFSAGAMLYVVVCELIPAADDRRGLFWYIAGFLLMMILDVALG
ncbi:MAG: ZIP family metal transporter [Clostridiales bacterium]|nr:ZIP family metal transporter [Clostridiales bacterium]